MKMLHETVLFKSAFLITKENGKDPLVTYYATSIHFFLLEFANVIGVGISSSMVWKGKRPPHPFCKVDLH